MGFESAPQGEQKDNIISIESLLKDKRWLEELPSSVETLLKKVYAFRVDTDTESDITNRLSELTYALWEIKDSTGFLLTESKEKDFHNKVLELKTHYEGIEKELEAIVSKG